MAVRAGDDALAKEALAAEERARRAARRSSSKQWQQQKDAVEKLKKPLRTLNDKIEEAKRKKNILIARKKRAEAQKAIQETMSGLQRPERLRDVRSHGQKIDQIEAEAEAGGARRRARGRHAPAEVQAARGRAGRRPDMALAELKAKMGLGPMPEARPRAAERARERRRPGPRRLARRPEALRASPSHGDPVTAGSPGPPSIVLAISRGGGQGIAVVVESLL